MPRAIPLLVVAGLIIAASGCGVTRQYTIPRDQDGALKYDSRSKLRMGWCINCYMREEEAQDDEEEIEAEEEAEEDPVESVASRPGGYQNVYAKDGLSVELDSSYRCFGWFLVIPFPFWGSCSSAVNVPKRQLIKIRITNKGERPWTKAGGPVRAFKGGSEIQVRSSDLFPTEIHPGESIIRAYDIGGWSELGWGYDLDLSGLLGDTQERIPFERFTSTTFGLYFTP